MWVPLVTELKRSIKSVRKRPAFAATVIATLSVGIGLNTAVFSVADAVLFRPLPYRDPEKLVELWERDPKVPTSQYAPRITSVDFWRQQKQVFANVETYQWSSLVITGEVEPESVASYQISPGLFSALGVAPALGRDFAIADAQTGNSRVMIVSDTFWRTRLGSSPDVLGKSLRLNDEPYSVIGVMPPAFAFPAAQTLFWVPQDATKTQARVNVLARLRSGLSFEAAQGGVDALTSRLKMEQPDVVPADLNLILLDSRRINQRPRQALLSLLGAVGFVLLLSCANGANLLLARAADRRGEIAVRMALGASRRRIVSELIMESSLLATAAGVAGVAIAWAGVKVLARIIPAELTFLGVATIDMDPRVLAFTLLATIFTSVAFGLLPAVMASRANASLALSHAKQASDRSHSRLRSSLVVFEVGLCVVLLVGAGLMARSFLAMSFEAPGFEAEGLLLADLDLPQHRYPSKESRRDFFLRLKETIAKAPGVESVSIASGAAPRTGGFRIGIDVEIEGRPPEVRDGRLRLPASRIDEDYFKTMRIPVLRGRGYPLLEQEGASPIIVNAFMAQRYWPNQDPIGSRIRYGREDWMTVIGVVGNVTPGPPGKGFSRMRVHHPFARDAGMGNTVVIRTAGEPESMISAIQARIRAMDKDLPIQRIETATALMGERLAEPRFYLSLLSCFGFVTLALVALGLYGVMAHSVAQRTREIGIRMAIGAVRRDVMRLVFGRGLALAVVGLVVGGGAAQALSSTMTALLFDAPARDPWTFAIVAVVLLMSASCACWIPARRATQVEPVVALRHE
jgi:putative ABC transport system permease protein